jgi:hypothetical protein
MYKSATFTHVYGFRRNQGLAFNSTSHSQRGKSNNKFFRKPKLKIQHDEVKFPAIYAPQRTYTDTQVSRKYLRIDVRNSGGKTATDCEARLITIPTIQQPYPAIQEVTLGWVGSVDGVNENIVSRKDIDPKSRELVHVVFSDSSFPIIEVFPPRAKTCGYLDYGCTHRCTPTNR